MNTKTIVVADEVWLGHVPTYHKIIVNSLLKLGYPVLSISPNPDDVKNWLIQQNTDCSKLSAILFQDDFSQQEREFSLPVKISNYFKNYLFALFLKLSLFKNYISKIRKKEKAELFWLKLNDIIKHNIEADINNILAILPYIDHRFIVQRITKKFIESKVRFNWIGLNIVKIILPRDNWKINIYNASNCKGLLILDESLLKNLKGVMPINIWLFPDVIDTNLPKEKLEVEEAILKQADGKIIISLLGVITPKKNLLLLLEVAEISRNNNLPYFFVFAGHLMNDAWTNDEMQIIQKLKNNKFSNCYFDFHRIEETTINRIVDLSSIIFLVYRDFNQSSNLLTKAAYFKKPVIVSKGYLMEERVKEYNLGLSVKQDSSDEIIEALKILTSEEWRKEFISNGVNNYAEIHSPEKVKSLLEEIINASEN